MKRLLISLCLLSGIGIAAAHARTFSDFDTVVLRSLDKITARTTTFEVQVGKTVQFGTIYIRPQSCRETPPVEEPESAAFLQVWEKRPDALDSEWVFSGWMFASSPGLSPMDHPVYDVWVLDCKNASSNTAEDSRPVEATEGELFEGEGEVTDEEATDVEPSFEGVLKNLLQ